MLPDTAAARQRIGFSFKRLILNIYSRRIRFIQKNHGKQRQIPMEFDIEITQGCEIEL